MTKPKLTQQEAGAKLYPFNLTERVKLLGIRGYYKTTMGNPVTNDRGIYDDAIFLITPEIFASFNANTDPSIIKKGIAVLKPGVWKYKKGKHKITSPTGYPAFVQADKVTVTRDQEGDDTGYFGVNIHKGGYNSTSSLGCQTIYPDQWEAFRALVYSEMDKYQEKVIPYVLIEES
jgi:hypothetical protein